MKYTTYLKTTTTTTTKPRKAVKENWAGNL